MLENQIDYLLLILSRELFESHELIWQRPFDLFRVYYAPFFIVWHTLCLEVSPLFNFFFNRVNTFHECPLDWIDVRSVAKLGKENTLGFSIFILELLIFIR